MTESGALMRARSAPLVSFASAGLRLPLFCCVRSFTLLRATASMMKTRGIEFTAKIGPGIVRSFKRMAHVRLKIQEMEFIDTLYYARVTERLEGRDSKCAG